MGLYAKLPQPHNALGQPSLVSHRLPECSAQQEGYKKRKRKREIAKQVFFFLITRFKVTAEQHKVGLCALMGQEDIQEKAVPGTQDTIIWPAGGSDL